MKDRTSLVCPLLRLALFVLLACSLEGCSATVRWHVVVDVIDVDGRPLQDARIVLRHKPARHVWGEVGPAMQKPNVIPAMPWFTSQRGRAEFTIEWSNWAIEDERPVWTVVISKEGFESIALDISPDVDHLGGSGPWPVRVRASLRADVGQEDVPSPVNADPTE